MLLAAIPVELRAQTAGTEAGDRIGAEATQPVGQRDGANSDDRAAPPALPSSLETQSRYDYNSEVVDQALDRYAAGLPVVSDHGSAPGMRGTPVRDRRHPEYAAPGLQLGSWKLSAQAGASVSYDSNVLRDADLDSKGDFYSRAFAVAGIASDWGRHSLGLSANFSHRFYGTYASKDGSEYSVDASGRLDVAQRSDLTLDARHSREIVEPFRSGGITGLLTQVRFDEDEVEGGGTFRGGRVELGGSAMLGRRRYVDAITVAGDRLDQSYRDYDRMRLEASAAYLLTGANAVFLSYTRDRRRYTNSIASVSPDVTTQELIGGIRGEITPLIRGQIGIGVLRSDYDDPALPTTTVLGLNSKITWLPTELTTVTLLGVREQEGSVRQSDGGYIATRFRAQVDHELLRNLLLLGQLEYEHDDYRATSRIDDIYRVTLGADWSVDHHLRNNIRIGVGRRSSNALARDSLSEFRITLGTGYAF
ncbi:outer membrane beta-barrel protein [Stakelama saccharophila]|uniref:Outer membrane beta-barrel protein n=1 Tax=Stakelama saccharophila TaxID=3075605 RepID=A0ABZ0BAV5_9SPHN|nr:outer membrane beta-barrel protein [Stakelama sp. W311]WNO54524.1 outer membrane beta-barrel protein [Stakelama sp. W311]